MFQYEEEWPDSLYAVGWNDVEPNFRINGTYLDTLEAAIYYARLLPGKTKIKSVKCDYESSLIWTYYEGANRISRSFRTTKEAEIASVLLGGIRLEPRKTNETDVAAYVSTERKTRHDFNLITEDLTIPISTPSQAYEFIDHIGGPVKLEKIEKTYTIPKRIASHGIYDD